MFKIIKFKKIILKVSEIFKSNKTVDKPNIPTSDFEEALMEGYLKRIPGSQQKFEEALFEAYSKQLLDGIFEMAIEGDKKSDIPDVKPDISGRQRGKFE